MTAAVRRAIAEARAAGVAIRYDRNGGWWYAFDEKTTQSMTFAAGGTLTPDTVRWATADLLSARAKQQELIGAEPLVDEPVPDWYDEKEPTR